MQQGETEVSCTETTKLFLVTIIQIQNFYKRSKHILFIQFSKDSEEILSKVLPINN